ncbi:NlpC/P60 family protein [Streptomyces sp. NPDC050418]|uniref:C40 family peptidase n=1 Tax=Streptomyces sp. NPDC050418 TaxID=3365612 RepID=UPI0037A4699D
MAAHRKPKPRSLTGSFTGNTARTALTLALAGAASTTLFEGSGQAEPRLTPAQVKAKVDRLYHDAEVATEKYNGAREEARKARRAMNDLHDEAARKAARLDKARAALGRAATEQYRSGGLDPTVQLALATDPEAFLERTSIADRTAGRQSLAIDGVRRDLREVDQLQAQAADRFEELGEHQAALKKRKAEINGKLDRARDLLATLSPADQASYAAGESGERASRSMPRGSLKAPNARAAQAVSFAYGALGSPYVWGASGPSAFDCSGLTQAAYRSAGVSLPRTTYTQINAGQRVSRGELAPGDLVFFYSGISHVGLYVGGGQMIHAPNPSAPVRLAPVDSMPFAGATRVA